MTRWNRSVLCLPLVAALAAPAWAGTITDTLADELSPLAPGDFAQAIVMMDEQFPTADADAALRASGATLAQRHETIVSGLMKTAEDSQVDVLAWLDLERSKDRVKDVRSLFVANMLYVEGTRELIEELAGRTDVGNLYPNYDTEIIAPIMTPEKPGSEANREGRTLGNGLSVIQADRVWHELGITGVGALVCNIDTGVDGNHPALTARWRGNHAPAAECFYDPVNGQSFPYDSGQHGTHTMGTITGMSPATGDTVGVAFGAEWINAATIDHPGGGGLEGTIVLALQSFQWALDPDGNPATIEDMPDVISNSWGIPLGSRPACDETYWLAIDNCEAAGEVVVFAAGNEGFTGLRTPPDRAASIYSTFAVAALDVSDPNNPFVASFSSRGPTPCSADPVLQIKPDIAAPGVNIYSSIPGGGYSSAWSGTSMACPHIAGVVALMRSANPGLDVNTIKQIIFDTAGDLDSPGEDNNVGRGLVNAYEAVLASMTGYGRVEGTVTDAGNANPVAATVTVQGGAQGTTADGAGFYFLSLPGDSSYTLNFSAFGYEDASSPVTTIVDDTVVLDVTMVASTPGTLSGIVWDTHGGTINGATISVPGTPIVPVVSGVGGTYSIEVPGNASYDFFVTAPGLGSVLDTDIFVAADANTPHDFFVPDDPIFSPTPPDNYGYVIYDMNDIGGPPYVWNSISGVGTPMTLSDDSYGTVTVPFDFGYYGTTYNQLSVASNGYVTPGGTGYTTYFNGPIPDVNTPNGSVYAHWDDLNPSAGGTVYTYFDAATHSFIVEFAAVSYYGGGGTVTMQVVVRDPAFYPTQTGDASFVLYFNQLGRTDTCTVGLENTAGNDGIQYVADGSYHVNASPLGDEFAMLITTGFLSEDPSLVLLPETVDLGVVYLGQSEPGAYQIQNLGLAQLDVTNIVSSNGQLTPTQTSYNIAPAAAVTAGFDFTPTALGAFSATLTLTSNDPNGPDALTVLADVQNPPDVRVTPTSLSADLFTGETDTQAVLIENLSASSVLDWTVSIAFDAEPGVVLHHDPARGPGQVAPRPKLAGEEQGRLSRPAAVKAQARPVDRETPLLENERVGRPLQELLDNLDADFTSISDLVPNRNVFAYDGWDGMSIGDGGQDMYDGGNYLNTDLGTGLLYSDDVVANAAMFGPGDYFTRHLPGLFVMVADLDGVSEFSITGNTGADGSGNVDGAVLSASVNGRTYNGFLKRVYNAFDPSINQLIIVESAGGQNHDYAMNTDDDYHRVTGLSGSERIFYALYASNSGGYIDDATTLTIFEQFLTVLADSPAWMTFTPESGSISGVGSQSVDAVFNATGLFGGVYTGTATVASNDPLQPAVAIPLTLTVTGAANIVVDPLSLDYGDVYVGGTSVLGVTVSNNGTDLLTISALEVDHGGFSVDGNGFALNPGDELVVPVSFDPTTVAVYNANLLVHSDDPDQPVVSVPLAGAGVAAPSITVDPASITETLQVDQTSVRTLTIGNAGGSELTATLTLDNIVVPVSVGPRPEPNPDALPTDADRPRVPSVRHIEDPSSRTLDVVIFRDHLAWGYDTNQPLLESLGATVSVATSADMGTLDINAYDMAVVESEQNLAFYTALQNNVGWFESYLSSGGVMQIHLSSNDRLANLALPGGAALPPANDLDLNNYISDFGHPIVQGLTDPLVGNSASHEHIGVLPGGSDVIIVDSTGDPTVAEYSFGAGHVLLSTMTWEWAVPNGYSAGDPLEPAFAYMLGIASGPDWIALGSSTVSVPAGGTVDVDVLFDATGLAEGVYTADILIASNDPLQPTVTVPATLIVGGDCAGDAIALQILQARPTVMLGIDGGVMGNTYDIYRSTSGYAFGPAPYASIPVTGPGQTWTDPQAPTGLKFYLVVESCPDPAVAVTVPTVRKAAAVVQTGSALR